MKRIEVRHHSIYGADKHLTREGRLLAQEVGRTLEVHYDLAIVSPRTRCRETMEAFGIADYCEDQSFARIDTAELAPFAAEARAIARTEKCSTLRACFDIEGTRNVLESVGRRTVAALIEIARELPEDGKALIVSHGGRIESAALVAFDTFDIDQIGGELDFCEGVLFKFEDHALSGVEVLRAGGVGG